MSSPLVSPIALHRHHSHMELLNGQDDDCDRHDTVGALTIDSQGVIAVALSSGGISLKYPGRVGDTAIPGAGFWIKSKGTTNIGCCTSGTCTKINICCNF